MEKNRPAYEVLASKSEGKILTERRKHRWKNITLIDPQEVGQGT
jgi:hypothetical protein